MRHSIRWLALCSVGLGAATGCSDVFGVNDVVGRWDAITVNGVAVPGEVEINLGSYNETWAIQYEYFQFLGDGQCVYSFSFNNVPGTVDDCTYALTLETKAIRITFQAYYTFSGTFDGNELTTMWQDGDAQPNTVVYRRMCRLPPPNSAPGGC